MALLSTFLALAALGAPYHAAAQAWGNNGTSSNSSFKHVMMISVDGMHPSDVAKWIALRPTSNISMLIEHAYQYTDAYTSAPSDSFPGTIAQYTGATPRTTGIWYDDTWDWTFWPPSSNCSGPPGANVLYDETIDYNNTMLFSGGIDPANLPQSIRNGTCQPIYPHERLRVNTIFELITAAGYQTAYTDKHPAYDVVRGPSGTGLTVGYFPEIAAVNTTLSEIIPYDQLHVNAWLDWINATTPVNTTIFNGNLTEVPTLFGGNFQSLSVAQKTIGYDNDTSNSLSAGLIEAFEFVDSSIGAVVNDLKAHNLYDDTVIVVASKHGQAPIQRSLYRAIDPTAVNNNTGVPYAWITTDDIALIWLNSSSDTAKCRQNLLANATAVGILDVIYGSNLTHSGFGNPQIDPAVPNLIVQPDLGVVYTTSIKDAEHGGLSYDDRVVACFLSNPSFEKKTFNQTVYTTQLAPTVLGLLGIVHPLLQGAASEGVTTLPGFTSLAS